MISRMLQRAERNLSVVFFGGVLTGSMALNLALATKYRSVTAPHIAGIKVGSDLKRIPTFEVSGAKYELRLNDGHWSVLYVMAPSCIWCARNLQNIRTLAENRDPKYRFIGISNTATGLARYLVSTPLPFQVLVADDAHAPSGLDTSATPQMALVRLDGRVERLWRGALDGKQQSDAEEFFHVKLPGLLNDIKR